MVFLHWISRDCQKRFLARLLDWVPCMDLWYVDGYSEAKS